MQQNKLIVSMTSYPARIEGVARVFHSILTQRVSQQLYHLVLVLAIPEFPNKLADLPKSLQLMAARGLIEIIWHPTNIKSHKKLIPTLLKYPDNPILVIDDDVLRPNGWLQCFINDHAAHPTDIITGMVAQYLDNGKFKMYPNREYGNTNYGTIVKNGRPANGRGGTLYPPHTFTDERFFDEALFMSLTPNSDESWQFFFNWRDQKPIRLISKQFNVSLFIEGTQEQPTALWKVNHRNNGYDKIWQKITDYMGAQKC